MMDGFTRALQALFDVIGTPVLAYFALINTSYLVKISVEAV